MKTQEEIESFSKTDIANTTLASIDWKPFVRRGVRRVGFFCHFQRIKPDKWSVRVYVAQCTREPASLSYSWEG